MRDPELYLIKLFRKAIHKAENEESQESTDFDISKQSENNKYDENGELSFLAMDYFDALMPQKVEIGDDMNTFMDIFASPDKKLSRHDIAMQSIPIYCLGEDIEKYDHSVPARVKGKDSEEEVFLYGNPFKEQNYPYLSLIQVYITPEIMARIDSVEEEKSNREKNVRNLITGSVIDQFYEDLHMIIEDYVREHYQRDRFICRIYRSMSAGDFTVAVSCNRPETPFLLATLFRERGCCYEGSLSTDRKYVFYKTYTLLSCGNRLIQGDYGFSKEPAESADVDDEFGIDGRFVLRIAYNNKYWGESADKNIAHEHARLNGRYDFSVELEEPGFRCLSKVLCDYKFGKGVISNQYSLNSCGDKTGIKPADQKTCEELIALIQDKHIAYINERYTFKCNHMNIFPKSGRKTRIRLRKETEKKQLLSKLNQREIEAVERRIDKVFVKVISLDTNRRNILYHLGLLRRMLNLCRSIDGLSDTRIYCSILIQQINVVLDGVEDFYIKIEDEKNRYLISIMEYAFVEAVDALNTYSKLIRDNNLQSLQTPNYSLESSVSVEKILVGYGELLNSLFKWYERTKVCEEIYGLKQQYIPFMIPGEQAESLRTKVLFKEVNAGTSHNKLMAVWSSAFSDLTNFGGTAGILFHEVAHNLRYRGRAERNRIILDYCTVLICDQIAQSIVDNLEQSIPDLMDSVSLTRLICDCLCEAYERVVYSDRDAYMYVRDFSYISLIDFINNEYDKFTEAVRQINNIDKFRRRCTILRPIHKNPRREEALERVKKLRDVLVTGANRSFARQAIFDRDDKVQKEILQYIGEAVEALEYYIQENEDENGVYSGDISAKAIYSSLLANSAMGTEFETMIDRYSLVDRFFMVFAERLDEKIEKIVAPGNSGGKEERIEPVMALEVRKVKSVLTHGINDKAEEPDLLAAYVSPHIVRTRMEAEAILKQFTFIYSEVASDLFMYNLVKMTPFGYFSFLSDYVPSDVRIPHTYIRRFCTVMYAAFSDPVKETEKAADKNRYWRGFVERIFNDYVKAADRALDNLCKKYDENDDEKYKEEFKDIFENDKYIIDVENDNGENIRRPLRYWFRYIQAHIVEHRNQYFDEVKENISFFDSCYNANPKGEKIFGDLKKIEHYAKAGGEEDYFENDVKEEGALTLQRILKKYENEYLKFMRSYIGNIYEIISNDLRVNGKKLSESKVEKERRKLHILEELQQELARWGFMASFLNRLYLEIHQEVATIERKKDLADDYRIGYYNTRRLQDAFAGDALNGSGDGCWMSPYFDELRNTLNHPELRYDGNERKKINRSMIEMISELYYRAIRTRAVFMISNSLSEDEDR